ncbi:MAG: hypothetical protein J4400_01420 [Candidatus Aenigmarchaeota archaeon]|nr:hypothetical protein [Candidatus Aenigmarchaeota archaeon]
MKMAVIFVNGLEKDPSQLIKVTSSAILGASGQIGMFGKKKMGSVETVPVQVIDIQTLWGIWYNAEKFGLKHFLATNDKNNMDPMQTALVVGPEEPEKLNKLSANLRLF